MRDFQRSDEAMALSRCSFLYPVVAFVFKPIPKKYARTGECYDCYNGSEIDGEVLERVVAATLYIPKVEGYVHSREILDLKDRGEFADQYAEVLLHVCAKERLDLAKSGLLVPVPKTTPGAAPGGPVALAESLSKQCGLPVARSLVFSREVRSQKGLKAVERKENVKNAMTSETTVRGRPVYLVDDVLTTGSTMHEGARAVREAGAAAAVGLVAGRDSDLKSLEHAGVLKRVED